MNVITTFRLVLLYTCLVLYNKYFVERDINHVTCGALPIFRWSTRHKYPDQLSISSVIILSLYLRHTAAVMIRCT